MSLKIITFANHKGGVSKTTSTASIGACMARMGKKFLNSVINKMLDPIRARRHEFEQDIPEVFNIISCRM